MKSVKRLTYGASVCALAVLAMLLGSLVSVADISCAVVASAFIFTAALEFSNGYAFLIFCASAVVSFFILPEKTPFYLFMFFAGWFPIFKCVIDARVKVIVAVIIKFAVFNIAVTAYLFFAAFVLMIPEIPVIYAVIYIAGNVFFFMYDKALSLFATYYYSRLRVRFEKIGILDKIR